MEMSKMDDELTRLKARARELKLGLDAARAQLLSGVPSAQWGSRSYVQHVTIPTAEREIARVAELIERRRRRLRVLQQRAAGAAYTARHPERRERFREFMKARGTPL